MKFAPRKATFAAQGEVLRPIIGLDIDGTVGIYHDHFLRFFEEWLGKPLPRGYDGSVSLAKWCGVSKSTYRKGKLAYRQGGLKRSMPTYPGSAECVRAWRSEGAEVAICTTRPFLSLEAVEPDTMHFLRRQGIQYDYVISGEHKYRELARFGKERIAFIADDLPEMIQQAQDLSLPTIVRSQPYNQDVHAARASDSGDLQFIGLAILKEWKRARE